MKLVTVATHSERFMPWLLQSCQRFNVDLHILGWDQPWQGFGWKLQLMQNFLQTQHPEEVICFADAYNVVLLRHLEPLETVFRLMHKTSGVEFWIGSQMSLGAGAWIEPLAHQYVFGSVHGHGVTTGVYVGFVSTLLRLMTDIHAFSGADDQVLLTHQLQCVSAPPTLIDTTGLLVLNLVLSPFWRLALGSDVQVISGQLLFHGVPPFFLHGNGATDISPLLTSLGYRFTPEQEAQFQNLHTAYFWQKLWHYIHQDRENHGVQIILLGVLLLLFFRP
jgi:hypothetical protein